MNRDTLQLILQNEPHSHILWLRLVKVNTFIPFSFSASWFPRQIFSQVALLQQWGSLSPNWNIGPQEIKN